MSQDDIELRDLITEKLANNGMLNNLKAQIRAAVLVALKDGKQTKIPTIEHKIRIDSVYQNFEGKLALSLVRDFMEKLNLKNTLSVFELESGLSMSDLDSRDSIIQEHKHLVSENKAEDPLMYSFIRSTTSLSNQPKDKEIVRGMSKNNSASNSLSPKSKRILPHLSDPIEYKSEDSSEFSDVVDLLDLPAKKTVGNDIFNYSSRIPKFIASKNDGNKMEIEKAVISPYQAPQKRTPASSGNEEHYDDSFSEKSSHTKHNQSDAEESINEIDVEEIDFKSEDRSGDVTVDSERSLSLDYIEVAKRKL